MSDEKQFPQIGVMRSKFAGDCVCGKPINVGDVVVWAKGRKSQHPECYADRVKAKPKDGEPTTWKRITSRFDGKCTACGMALHAGDEVMYSKGNGARHPECMNGPHSQAEAINAEHPYDAEREAATGDDSDIPF